MAGSAVITFGLFGAKERNWKTAGLCLLLGGVLGLLCAKVTYYICQIDFMIASGWKENLFRMDPDGLNFYGGVAGVCFGVAIAARLTGKKPVALLDRFAPFGLLLGALVRFAEYFAGMLGVGLYLEDEAFCFFPLAKGFSWGDWTEWYLAVFVLEGISLLAVALVSALCLKEHRFLRSVFYMCLPQILLENLRYGSMMWFFCIRVDQLACMVAMFVILVIYGTRMKDHKAVPAIIALLCAGLFIAMEFALEGKIPFLRFMNAWACYGVMLLGQVILGVVEVWAYRKTTKTED